MTSNRDRRYLAIGIALSPTLIIALFATPSSQDTVFFVLNGALSFAGAFILLRRPSLVLWETALGAIGLGALFFALNVVVGGFAGCVCHPPKI